FDWITGQGDNSQDIGETFDFGKFVDTCDSVIFGRKAYEDNPEEGFTMIKDKKLYIASNTLEKADRYNVEFIKGDVVAKVLEMKKEQGKNIWLFGGANLTDDFIKADVIDEYIIGIIPCILGKGRKLFLDNNPMIKLRLEESSVSDGVTILRYTKRNEN
ncbi:MAG: dihydrofolate reductase family protein, partial [Paraclostridium sp.]